MSATLVVTPTTTTAQINTWLATPTPNEVKHLIGRHVATQQIRVPSNTHLNLGLSQITRAHSAGGNGGATIVNTDQVGGNTNITITGGILDVADGYRGKHFGFVNVTGLRITDNVITRAAGDFMAVLKNCHQVAVSGLRWSGSTGLGEDGLHLYGGSGYVVSDCHIESGDDALALTVETGDNLPLEQVEVVNCVLSSVFASAIKLHTKPAAVNAVVRHVHISNVSVRQPVLASGHHAIRLMDDTDNDTGIYDVTLRDISVDMAGGPGVALRSFGVDQLTVDGLTVWNANGVCVFVEGGAGTVKRQQDLRITGVRCMGQSATGQGGVRVADADVFTVSECVVRDPKAHGIHVLRSREGVVRGNHVSGSTQSGIRLDTASRVHVSGNTVTKSDMNITSGSDTIECTFADNRSFDNRVNLNP